MGLRFAGSLSVRISAALWLRWARIAVEQERAAIDGRHLLERSKREGQALPLDAELEPSMLAISAAAHALDGLYGSLRELVDPNLREQWSKTRLARPRQVFETLKRTGGIAVSRSTDIDWLYSLRDAAVHHQNVVGDATPHPAAVLQTGVAPEYARYCAENAQLAVSLVLAVATTVVSNADIPEAQRDAWQRWLDELASRRADAIK